MLRVRKRISALLLLYSKVFALSQESNLEISIWLKLLLSESNMLNSFHLKSGSRSRAEYIADRRSSEKNSSAKFKKAIHLHDEI